MSTLSTSSAFEVLILEDGYYCDLIFTGVPGLPSLGSEIFSSGFNIIPGGAFNLALAFKRLDLHAGWPCQFGNDLFSRYVAERAAGEGIDCSLFTHHDFPIPRITASLSFPQDRAFVTYNHPFSAPPPAELILKLRPRFVIEAGLHHGPLHLASVAAAHQVGALVYMDSDSNDFTLDDPEIFDAIRAVDIFAPNAKEALKLTHASTLEEAIDRLGSLVPLLLVKRSCDGAIARQGKHEVKVAPIPVEVFDTTGAGDCFNAGFLYGQLRGYPLETSLQCANICGALATTGYGATAVPTALELEARLHTLANL